MRIYQEKLGKLARAQKERETERMSWRASASFANLRLQLTAEIEKILGKIFGEEMLEQKMTTWLGCWHRYDS
jgi:hypothetical protein